MPIVQIARQVLLQMIAILVLGATFLSVVGLWFATVVFQGDMVAIVILAATYILLTVAYATGASLYLQPKQFVSPTLIQVIAIPISTVLIIDLILRRPFFAGQDWASFVSLYAVLLAAIATFLLTSSYYALSPITEYLVGLTGSSDDLCVSQLLVHAPHHQVLAEFIDPDFQYAFGIDEQEEVRPNVWIFKTDPKELGNHRVVAVSPHYENRKFTQIVLVSYELAHFGILPSSRTKLLHSMDLQTTKTRLKRFKIDDDKRLKKTKLLPALTLAYETALSCTEARILAVGRLPAKFKAVLVATVLLAVLIGILGWFGKITADSTQSGLVFTGIAIIFEFIPFVTLKRGSRRQ